MVSIKNNNVTYIVMISVLLSFFLIIPLSLFVYPIKATKDIIVNVTISDGSLALAAETISVSDKDSDGNVTFNDAMILAHDKKYDGGSSAGYGYDNGEYGMYMTRLWGTENGGSYGYYLNNRPAPSLDVALNNGDSLYAFVITDTKAYSDLYCYFDVEHVGITTDEHLNLTLTSAGYDDNWSIVIKSVANASLTINGTATGIMTDANGIGSLTFLKPDTYIISATSNASTLVPPVCIVTVTRGSQSVEAVVIYLALAVIAIVAVVSTIVILIRKKRK